MNWTEKRLKEKDLGSPEPVERSLLLSMVFGWCVPGLGHVYMKKYLRGTIFFLSIVLLFIAGLSLSQWTYTTRADFPFYLTGKYGSGIVLFGHYLLTEHASIDLSVRFHYMEIGVLFLSVAGLLNAISVLNLIDVKWGRSLLLDLHEKEVNPEGPQDEDDHTV